MHGIGFQIIFTDQPDILTTENLVYPLLSLIPALLNAGILVYLLFAVPRTKTTDIFSLFVLFLLLWQAEDTIVRICESADRALFWVKIFCVGWAGFAPVAFHFACRYTSLKAFYTRYSLLAIYVPSVVFYLLYIATANTAIFAHRPGWNFIVTPRPHTLDGLQRLLISLYVIGAVVVLFRYAYTMRNQKEKRLQSLLVAFGIFIPAVQGIITQIIFPVFLGIPDIPITSSFLTLFSVATILSIRKYNLFNISESVEVKTVVENLKNIVMVVSPRGLIIYLNPYGQHLLAMKSADETDLRIQSFFGTATHYGAFVEEAFAPSLKGTTITDYATVFKTGLGRKIDVLVSAEMITNNNQVQGVLLVANDVTELSKTLRDLEKSNKELEQFAYIASHDLQEPMRKVSAHLELLEIKYKDKLDDKAMSYINVAINSANQMRNLIEALREYANISYYGENVDVTDMNAMVEEVTKTLAVPIEEAGAQLTLCPLPEVKQTNTMQLQQLFENLLSNALKYRHPDRVLGIKIFAGEVGDYWQFGVEDNGLGILPEYREKVFAVFKRLHGKTQYSGTGVGLAICKKIIDQHGGRIWIESNEQGGSTFFFTLPK